MKILLMLLMFVSMHSVAGPGSPGPASLAGLHPPVCSLITPNVRPPLCVDYNKVFSRAPVCNSANLSVLPPDCSLATDPSPVLTPGSSFAVPTLLDICNPLYEATIPAAITLPAIQQQVFVTYGFPFGVNVEPCVGGCTLDNLIPIGLGGDNTLSNLWPQPTSGAWTAAMKNTLETTLRSRVCTITAPHLSSVPLATARQEIATNWKAAYTKYVTNQQ